MYLIEITIENRIYLGVAAMLVLFISFVAALVVIQRKKLQFHRERQDLLTRQNQVLEEKVAERTQELDQKNRELQESLKNLRTTQQRLIQREKMASLGELTAGIAHEIKNPLNFVNNFSELSQELFNELEDALANGDQEEAQLLTKDLKHNMEKIRQHGSRADNIVKGMLSHSHTSLGTVEATILSELVESSVQLSYHGCRALNKGMVCKINYRHDASLPQVEVNTTEIGRVIINICNNAFYAMVEKAQKTGTGYSPELDVSTHHHGNFLTIKIRDNGAGIDPMIRDKIFQPFFTTKPTGEGTGLGLSMSYDIVVNGHAGNMEVDSVPGEWTCFTIELPVNRS